jgi:hypothetical protein
VLFGVTVCITHYYSELHHHSSIQQSQTYQPINCIPSLRQCLPCPSLRLCVWILFTKEKEIRYPLEYQTSTPTSYRTVPYHYPCFVGDHTIPLPYLWYPTVPSHISHPSVFPIV